jgi:hypothetical protein
MALTRQDIEQIASASRMSTGEWREVAKMFAAAQKDDGVFSQYNKTGVAGGRGVRDDESYRTAEASLKTEIRLKKLANAQSEKTSKMLKRFNESIDSVHPKMKSFGQDVALVANTLDTHIERINERFESAADEIKFWEKHTSQAGRTIFQLHQKIQKLNKVLEDQNSTNEERLEAEEKLLGYQKERAEILKKANPQLTDAAKNIVKVAAGMVAAGALQAGGQMMGDVEAQRRFGTPGSMAQQLKAALPGGALMGIDPQLVSELAATNRAAVIAMGGAQSMEGVYERLGSRLNELANITGTRTEALKFELTSYQTLIRSGIKPTEDALNDQVKSLTFMQEALGMTAEEFTQLQQQLVTNTDFRRKLNGLSERERRGMLNRLNDQIAINRANGMMRDHAIAAALALEELAGKGPRDRIKEMAKLQAIGAMAGVQMSEEARQGFIRGQSASKEQQKAMQEFKSSMGDRLTEIKSTMGGTGTEFGIFGALEKAGIGMEYFDASLTNLGDQIKMGEGPQAFQEGFHRMVEQMGPLEEKFNQLTTAMESFRGVLENVAGGGVLHSLMNAAGAGLGAFIGARGMGGLKGLFSRGAGAIAGGASAIKGAGAGALGWLGGLGGGATVAGAGAGTIAGAGALAAGGGYLAGTGINNFFRLFGGRQISTMLLDKFTDFNDYDPNADVPANKTADSTAALVSPTEQVAEASVKQLSESEKHTELLRIMAENMIGAGDEAAQRQAIANIQNGQQPVFN